MKGTPRFAQMFALLIFCSCLLSVFSFYTKTFGQDKKHVLVLHSYHSGLEWTDNENEGISSILKSRADDIEVHTEYMDTKRISDPEHYSRILKLFEHKYAATAFKVIISTDDDAYNFVVKNHNGFFADVPLVFCGVNYYRDPEPEGSRDLFTGVVEAFDIPNTLRAALRLHPKSSEIVVINDRTTTGLANKRILDEVIPEFKARVSFSFFEDLDMAELLDKVRSLPSGAIILLMTFNRDRAGQVFDYDESIAQISQSTKVPIYGVWEFYLGKGIVGGMLTSGREQGRSAAEMALRIVDGEPVGNIPVVKESPNRFMFDYRQLKQFDIALADLPEDSVTINRPASLYQLYPRLVWGASVGFAGLVVVIILLLIHIRVRRHAEVALAKSEDRFRALYESNPSMYFTVDEQGLVLSVNPFGAEQLGLTVPELIGQPVLDLFPPEDREVAQRNLTACLKNPGEVIHGELRKLHRNGNLLWVRESARAVRSSDGNHLVVLIVCEDITERKRAEEELGKAHCRVVNTLESITDGFVAFDRDWRFTYINTEAEQVFGMSREDLFGRSHWEAFPFMVGTDIERCYRRVMATREAAELEYFHTPEGSWLNRWIALKVYPAEDGGLIVYFRDISGRKQAEEDLRKSEMFLNSIVENIPNMIFVKDAEELRFVRLNKAGEELLGYSRDELIGKRACDLFPKHEADFFTEKDQEVLGGKVLLDILEERIQTPDRGERILHTKKIPILDGHGAPQYLLGISEDITERKREQDELFNSRQMLQSVLDNIPQRVFWKDRNSIYVGCNKPLALDCGYQDPSELVGKTDYETASAAFADLFRADDREVMETGRPKLNYEEPQIKADGSQGWLIASKVPMHDKDGQVVGVLGTYDDITERKRAEEERIRLATAVEQLAEAVFITDTDWIIRYVNPAFERMSGYEKGEIIGQHAAILRSDKHDDAFHRGIRQTLSAGEVWSGRLVNKREDGKFYEAEVTASPVRDSSGAIINYVTISRDITNEVRLEKELRQAQKMEAIGTLAGGIAHDFNNILSAIMGYTEMAWYKLPEESPVRHSLQQVLDASSRATDMVKQILTFSRQTEQEKKAVQVALSVKEVLKLLRPSLPTTIEIRQEISVPPERTVVLADPTEIHQVLMNLCANAAHAMRVKGGILSLKLSEVVADPFFVSRHPDLKEGLYVCLTIGDTGHGMDAAVMERIFDPYFTTKRLGEGTGLGLSVVQGIVKSYGGVVIVYSEPGKGTTFSVLLPSNVEEVPAPVEVTEAMPTGTERILFVDDERILVDLGREMLESLGYSVETRTSSIEALDVFRTDPDAFDLVITDMTMPGLTGAELAKELMTIKSDLPMILCTGFSELINERQAGEAGISAFVMKPYVVSSLAKSIRRVLHPK